MEAQSFPQRDGPAFAIILDDVSVRHLWLHGKILVNAEQGVEHQVTMIAGGPRLRPYRIQHGQIAEGPEFQDLRAIRPRYPGRGKKRGRYRGLDEVPTEHSGLSASPLLP